MKREIKTKVELYNDNFENFKRYNIPSREYVYEAWNSLILRAFYKKID